MCLNEALHKKFHGGILKGVINISHTLEQQYEFSRARGKIWYLSPPDVPPNQYYDPSNYFIIAGSFASSICERQPGVEWYINVRVSIVLQIGYLFIWDFLKDSDERFLG